MKMKWGALVVDGRGKIGGQVASKNRSGAYLRTKVTPVNPRTPLQLYQRRVFGMLSQAWRGLTQAQRDAWNAAAPAFLKTDVFGDPNNISGFNLFKYLNDFYWFWNAAILTSPPAPASFQGINLTSASIDITTSSMSLAFTPVIDAVTAGNIFATAPVSPGISNTPKDFRNISTWSQGSSTPQNIWALYSGVWGAPTSAGQKIFFKCVSHNVNTGQRGSISIASGIIIAS